jgi:precorrin-6A synthase
MRRLLIIGIGAGDPDYMTVQAIRALGQVDVFFAADKGAEKEDLAGLRTQICERFIEHRRYRSVRFADPQRGSGASANAYRASVDAWHGEREAIYERLLREELREGETGAFLAWGDPSLYDSTLRIVDRIRTRGALQLECEVIPGISSVQALCARHGIALSRIGESVQITTGRQLAAGLPVREGSVVVMLDGECAFKTCAEPDLEIYWGAYLGTPDEILIAGPLREVMDQIETTRRRARAQKGWIMDTYLLRRAQAR